MSTKVIATCIGIFVLALVVRFVYLYESSTNPSFDSPIVDSMTYDSLAWSLAKRGEMPNGFFWQGVFYPLFLSIVYLFSRSSIVCAKIIQILLGCVSCVLTYRLGERVFGRRAGILAGVITALYGPLVFFESELLASGWAVFWSVVLILLLLNIEAKKRMWLCFVLGLSGGLSIITRPTFIAFFLAGCFWLWAKLRRQPDLLRPGLRFGVAGLLLVVVPVGIMGLSLTGRFSILPPSGGLNLYIGNNPDYIETLTIRPGEKEWVRLTELPQEHGVNRDWWSCDRFYRRKVLEYAISEPLSFAKGLARKTVEFVNSREIPRNIDIYMFGKWSRLLRGLTWKAGGFGFPFGVVFPLAVVGLIYCWRQIPGPVKLFVLFYPLAIISVFVAGRYRVPVVPVVSILAAGGFFSIVKMIQVRQWRRVTISAAIVAGVVLISSLPGPFCEEEPNYEAEFYGSVGDTALRRGQLDEAMVYFTEALRLNPDYQEVHNNMGILLVRKEKTDEGIKHYREALRLNPNDYRAHDNLGHALAKKRRFDEAIAHYRKALRLKPDYPEAIANLESALKEQGQNQLSD